MMLKEYKEVKENQVLLNNMIEIARGQWLSVPNAIYDGKARSPVEQMHSLNFDKKKVDDIALVRENIKMARRIQKTESHTKVDDLESEWTE